MRKYQPFMVLLSVTVAMGSLLSSTGAAQGCLYQQYDSGLPGFTEPLSGSDSLTPTSFLESREMTMASAAAIAGLLGLGLLFRQSKQEPKAAEKKPPEPAQDQADHEKPPEAVQEEVAQEKPPEPAQDQADHEKPPEAVQEKEKEHPEAPGGQLDVKQEKTEEKEEKKEAVAAQ
jgi:outer membrane biosynthesis protein TonB